MKPEIEKVMGDGYDRELQKQFTSDQIIAELEILLDPYDWFYTVKLDERERITVYVQYMNSEIFAIVPDKLYGREIFMAFTSYLLCGEMYGKKQNAKMIDFASFDFVN